MAEARLAPRPKATEPSPLVDLVRIAKAAERPGRLALAHMPDGFDAFVAADLARALARKGPERSVVLMHVAREGQRAQAFRDALAFAAPDIEMLDFPAWDCQPYDRVSPQAAIEARRMIVLSRLARSKASKERPRILSTTVSALTQRVPPRAVVGKESFSVAPGNSVSTDDLAAWLETNGFLRSGTVHDTGEYAVRGGIVDLFAPGMPQPVRLDFFGHTLESIRSFDPESQRSTGQMRALDLVPMSEVQITTDTMRRFRQAYVAAFGTARGDALYDAISEGRRHQGMEHWLPLFHGGMDTLFDYADGCPVLFDALVDNVADERFKIIVDHHDARAAAQGKPMAATYKPLPADALYLTPAEWGTTLKALPVLRATPFDAPEDTAVDCGGRPGRSFAPERADEGANVFDAALTHIRDIQADGRTVIVAGWSDGSRERLRSVLLEHGLKRAEPVSSLGQALGLPKASSPWL